LDAPLFRFHRLQAPTQPAVVTSADGKFVFCDLEKSLALVAKADWGPLQ
jgi:hypothetical protein